jgi:Leucine-rich repeat (LRR) protein
VTLTSELERLESEDRGFLTWIGVMARLPLPELAARLEVGTTLTPAGTQLETLDLSPLGGLLRERAGPKRKLSLPLGGLDALVALDCTGLDLDELDLRPLRGLKRLRCGKNRLAVLELAGHPELEELSCPDNVLDTLDLRGLSALRQADLRGNPLSTLHLGEHPLLTTMER